MVGIVIGVFIGSLLTVLLPYCSQYVVRGSFKRAGLQWTIFVQRAPGDQWEERLLLAPASSQSWVTANPTLRVSIEKVKDFRQVLIGGP